MFVRNEEYPETPRSKTEYTSPEGETSFLQKCFGAYDRVYRHAVSAGTAKWRTSEKPNEQAHRRTAFTSTRNPPWAGPLNTYPKTSAVIYRAAHLFRGTSRSVFPSSSIDMEIFIAKKWWESDGGSGGIVTGPTRAEKSNRKKR